MVVGSILKTCSARCIGAVHLLKVDGPTVGEDETIPQQKDAPIAMMNAALVSPDEARALRNENVSAANAVVDGRRNLRDDAARLIGIQCGDERGRDR